MRDRAGGRWVPALLAVAETALVGWALTVGPDLLWALAQALVLVLGGLLLVGARYLRLRGEHRDGLARAAAQDERLRLAEDLHDVLGHELSLVALRAGALQLSTRGAAAEQAAAVRAQVADAVLALGQVVELLRSGGRAARLCPVSATVSELVERSRRTGTDVVLHAEVGTEDGTDVAEGPREVAARVVLEGLTNAAKHAPGSRVEVRLARSADRLEVTVGTDDAPATTAGAGGSGLPGLQRQLTAAGGRCWTERPDGRHLLRASIPLSAAEGPGPRAGVTPTRRPALATLRWALPPALTAVALVVGFYSWSSRDATLEPDRFAALRPGEAATALPPREAVVRLTPAPPAPPVGDCAYYSDGNFPLAMASFEVCVVDGRVSRVTDLRDTPPW